MNLDDLSDKERRLVQEAIIGLTPEVESVANTFIKDASRTKGLLDISLYEAKLSTPIEKKAFRDIALACDALTTLASAEIIKNKKL